MNIYKEYDSSCVYEDHRPILTYKIERIRVDGAPAAAQINAFFDELYGNVRKYVTESLSKEERTEDITPDNRAQRLHRSTVRYLLETSARCYADDMLSVSISVSFGGRRAHRAFVISCKDGRFENPESFISFKRVKRYMKDDISILGDSLMIFHKGKKIKMETRK